ncbi:MAG: hypothetical protein KBD16_00755 [Candidatus Pacebacteria bacterium]|nr:hypothetical protein [Candidatus Paceibacterota bacterium]
MNINYVDSMSPEEREGQAKIQAGVVYTSTATPTTPSEWESNFYGFWTDNRITYSVMRDYIRSLIHHNTEDIIERVLNTLNDEVFCGDRLSKCECTDEHSLQNAVYAAVAALKPTHKE